ncbi:hypothetical protein KW785_02580, partial [Candidatus Parcubacteria bacterium]|nr:hypothetical protein [Candidatus Parcubacteria bacterium]
MKNISLAILLSVLLPQGLFAATATAVSSPFTYHFSTNGTLVETNLSDKSSSGYWWLSSGAKMNLLSGAGQTLHGSLPTTDPWRVLYATANPSDTDNGYHPQNIFRLVGRSLWHNVRQEAYFKIDKDNLSGSSNRNASNGLFFFNRYQDQDNVYYSGLRVDGYAVVKKKLRGSYTTLTSTKVFSGAYNRASNPNLLPKNTPIGFRTETTTSGGKVYIKLYTDVGKTGTWKLVASATDTSSIMDASGYGGIRTDFMDVTFDDYKMSEI